MLASRLAVRQPARAFSTSFNAAVARSKTRGPEAPGVPRPPPVLPEHLPQFDHPSRTQKGFQLAGFVFAVASGAYCVLFYDWADKGRGHNIFTDVREYVREGTSGWWTLSEGDRKALELSRGGAAPKRDV